MNDDPFWMPRMGLRDDWLGQVREDILDPGREIVDPHHHLWSRGGNVYEADALARDLSAGHNVVQTVYIECYSYYDTDAPDGYASVGETRTVAQVAQTSAIAGIVGHADLRRADLDAILDAHQLVDDALLKGIRQSGAHDPDAANFRITPRGDAGLYSDPDFRRGLARLGARGLTYDAWHYHHQAADFLALAQAVPDTTLVLDHFGTPLGVRAYDGRRSEIHSQWLKDMKALAACPNVVAKLGGFAMPDNGWGWEAQAEPVTSDALIAAQGAWYSHMLDCFGPDRCMFESNFPVDRMSVSYPVLWNAFKKIAAPYSGDEKDALFAGTARRVYGL